MSHAGASATRGRAAGRRRAVPRLAFALASSLGGCGSPPAANPSAPDQRSAPVRETPPDRDPEASPTEPAPPELPWLKGQLHLHSNASGDSETPPAEVVRWYAEHGYDFIVFTDHNRITEIAGTDTMLVLPGIELTQNLERCEPPPEPGLSCLLHVNGLLVGTDTEAIASIPTPDGLHRLERFTHAIEVTHALGGLAMLNHPNFHYAADADLIAALAGRGLPLLEVANEAVDSNNAGDAAHPSTEALWDAALSTGARVWGTATDDAHHYYDAEAVRTRGELAHVGDRGWVMVRARPEAAAIRSALAAGDFYASNGVTLRRIDREGDTLRLEVDDTSEGVHRFHFIGDGGRVLHRHRGRAASFAMPPEAGYVRVEVLDRRGRKAWTQPAWPGG